VRIRVAPAEVPTAGATLERLLGPGIVRLDDIPTRDWLVARCNPSRAGELNRVLAEAGVYASRIEVGATLEALFLTVTGSTPDVQAGMPR
jgi:hypothetical protein